MKMLMLALVAMAMGCGADTVGATADPGPTGVVVPPDWSRVYGPDCGAVSDGGDGGVAPDWADGQGG